MMKKLSVHVIARETEHLDRALLSLHGVADEIVLISDSLEKIEKVECSSRFAVNGNIAEMRNRALEESKADWILFLDSEEVISQPTLKKLKGFLEDAEDDAYIIPIHQYTNKQNLLGWKPSARVTGYSGYIETTGIRVIRNLNTIRFEMKATETLLPSLKFIDAKIKQISDIHINKYGDSLPANYLEMLQEQLQIDPNNEEARYLIGKFYLQESKWAEAHEMLYKLADNHYKNSAVQDGVALLNLDNPSGAAMRFVSAIKKDQNNISAYNNLAALMRIKKDYAQAEKIYQQALSVDRKDARLFHALITLYIEEGKREEALRLLLQARKIHPRHQLWSEIEKGFNAQELIGE